MPSPVSSSTDSASAAGEVSTWKGSAECVLEATSFRLCSSRHYVQGCVRKKLITFCITTLSCLTIDIDQDLFFPDSQPARLPHQYPSKLGCTVYCQTTLLTTSYMSLQTYHERRSSVKHVNYIYVLSGKFFTVLTVMKEKVEADGRS